jgi:hypothetical protein
MDPCDDPKGIPCGVAVTFHRYWLAQKREPN